MNNVRTPLAGMLVLSILAGAGRAPSAIAQSQTAPPVTASQFGPELETVVVTSEKRPEKLQDVPITMTVVSQKQLDRQNIVTTSDLVKAVPSLTATDEGVFQIRSIGTQGFGRSAEQSVSVVLDGVVLDRTLSNALYDLENVEVLSGPQGMLFGKNSNAGVINIVTHAPVLNEYQAIGHVDLGDHTYVHGYAIGNLPIGENAALRLSYHHDENGHVVFNTLYNLWDHNSDDGVRLRLLWRPLEQLTVNLAGDYQKLSSNGVNGVADFAGVAVFDSVPPGTLLATTLAACGVTPSPYNNRECANSLHQTGVATGNTYGRDNGGAALTLDYSLWRDLTLTSITAWRKSLNEDFDVDGDLSGEFGDTLPQNLLDRNLVPYWARTFRQELRLQTPNTDTVNFVAGLYYSKDDSHDRFDQAGALGVPLPPPLEFRRRVENFISSYSYAAFGQVNFHLTSKWQTFLGARVTHDHLSDLSYNTYPGSVTGVPPGPYIYTGNTGFFSVFPVSSCTLAGGDPGDPGIRPSLCPPGTSLTDPGTLSKTGWSGKVGLQYQPDPGLMFFGTVARGYKGPFINEAASLPAGTPDAVFAPQLVVKPEYALDFELGVKSTLSARFALDASLFYERFNDYQTTIYVPPSLTQLVANFIQGNARYAATQGVQVDFYGQPFHGFTVNGGLLFNNAHFYDGFLVNCGTGPCPALPQLPQAPRWKGTFSGEYGRPVGDRVGGFAQADLAYSSSYPYGSAPGFPPATSQYQVDGRLGARGAKGKWSVAVFCRNCLDKRYPILRTPDGLSAVDGGLSGAAFPTVQFFTINSYRVVGVSLDARF
jgi:iron complex outermembrane receptor protein